MSDSPFCACLRIASVTVPAEDGSGAVTQHWECLLCRRWFVPRHEVLRVTAERDQLRRIIDEREGPTE